MFGRIIFSFTLVVLGSLKYDIAFIFLLFKPGKSNGSSSP